MSAVSDTLTEKYLVDGQHLQFVWYTLQSFTNNVLQLQDLKIDDLTMKKMSLLDQ